MYSVDNGFILSHGTIQVKAYGGLYHGHCYGPVVYISPENPVSLRKKGFCSVLSSSHSHLRENIRRKGVLFLDDSERILYLVVIIKRFVRRFVPKLAAQVR